MKKKCGMHIQEIAVPRSQVEGIFFLSLDLHPGSLKKLMLRVTFQVNHLLWVGPTDQDFERVDGVTEGQPGLRTTWSRSAPSTSLVEPGIDLSCRFKAISISIFSLLSFQAS